MLKKIAIGLFVVTCVYVWVSGDYTFAGPRYRALAYAHMAAAQFSKLRSSSATDSRIAENQSTAAPSRTAAGGLRAPDRTYIHLGSLRDAALAKEEWSRLQRTFPAELANLDLILDRVRLQSEGVVYRVLADTAESPLSPGQLCSALRQNKQFCALVKPGAT